VGGIAAPLGSTFVTYPTLEPGADADLLHGATVADPYRVLEVPTDPVTVGWSAAQRALFDAHRDDWTARPGFAEQLTALARTGSVGTPVFAGDRWFATHRAPGQEHAVLGTGIGTDTTVADRVLVDPGALDPSGATTLDSWEPSIEGDRVAVQISAGGTEESTITVLDAATGDVLDGPVDRARYSPVAWLPGGGAFYYVRRLAPELVPDGEAQFHRRVYLHRLGTDPDSDIEIFGTDEPKTTYFDAALSRDGRWLVISASAGTAPRTDVWIADLTDAAAGSAPEDPKLRPVHVGLDARSSVSVGRDGRLYALTDLDAPRGRLCVADPRDPEPGHWRDLIAEDREAVLESWALLDGREPDSRRLLVGRIRHAVAELTVHDAGDGAELAVVTLPGSGSIGELSVQPDGGTTAWFAYADHTTPTVVLRLDVAASDRASATTATGGGSVLTPAVHATAPGVPDLPSMSSRLETYTSADGTTVRIFVLSPDGVAAHPRPTVLYGYGGFGIAMAPVFTPMALAWVAAGGVWAIACLRGGGEEGEAWHRAGMREHKQSVFDDFAAAARWLVDAGWTTPAQLGIFGGSNGGLLVGAALTQHPELVAAVVCSAPLLDMVRYERFGLGESWNDEFGTAADPIEFGWLHGYSPYHHVVAGTAYPAVLFTIFDGDTRVDPLHARKLAAALQAATGSDQRARPILGRAEADVGHGARSVTRGIDLGADELAFLAHHTGLLRGSGPADPG
jgi:prolyl oligopeptidase